MAVRDSSRTGGRRPRVRKNLATVPTERLVDLEGPLAETRSLLACATACLYEIEEPRSPEAPDVCQLGDVVLLIRLAVKRVRRAKDAIDLGGVQP